MAITRTADTDDDGTGTTGTIYNNAWKTALYDAIDSADCLDKSTTEQDVVSSVAGVAIYTYSVAGGVLSTNKTLRLTITGRYLNTSGGNSTLTVNASYGATAFVAGLLQTFATGTTGPWRCVIEINANGLTNSQRALTTVTLPASGVALAAGAWGVPTLASAFHNTLAEDSTAAKVLTMSVQHSVNSAVVSFKRFAAFLEVLG